MKKTIELHKRWKDDPSKGEVFTPEELVREMLDKIPTSVWENPMSTFLDPCMGKGTFLIDILRRLTTIYGYSKEDAMSRIYGYDVRVKYINYLKRGGFKNVFHKDFLSEEFNMKFDVVIGNPPYQENTGKKGKTAATLWPRFIQKSLETLLNVDGFLVFVTPLSWMGPGKQLIRNRHMPSYFTSNKLLYLNTKCGEHFKVGSTFSYYVVQKVFGYNEDEKIPSNTVIETNDSKFSFDYTSMNLDFFPIINSLDELSIINKFFSYGEKLLLKSSSLTRSDKEWVSNLQNDEFSYPVKHTNTQNLFSSKEPEAYGVNKVILNSTGNFNPIYDEGLLGTTQITRWIEVENEIQGTNLIKFLNSKVCKFVFEKCRWSGSDSKKIYEMIPNIGFNNEFSDEELFLLFSLSEVEKKLLTNE